MAADDLGHQSLRLSLAACALGALPEDERRLVEEHLDECGSCRDELASFGEVVEWLDATALPVAQLSPGFTESVVAAAEALESSTRRARPGSSSE